MNNVKRALRRKYKQAYRDRLRAGLLHDAIRVAYDEALRQEHRAEALFVASVQSLASIDDIDHAALVYSDAVRVRQLIERALGVGRGL